MRTVVSFPHHEHVASETERRERWEAWMAQNSAGCDSPFMIIKVVQALDLRAVDKGATSDPFVVVRCHSEPFTRGKGRQELEFKTAVKKKTLNPCWDEVFFVNLPPTRDELFSYRAVLFQVYDWNAVTRNVLLGEASVTIGQALQGYNNPWTDLDQGQGKIRVSVNIYYQGSQPDETPLALASAVNSQSLDAEVAARVSDSFAKHRTSCDLQHFLPDLNEWYPRLIAHLMGHDIRNLEHFDLLCRFRLYERGWQSIFGVMYQRVFPNGTGIHSEAEAHHLVSVLLGTPPTDNISHLLQKQLFNSALDMAAARAVGVEGYPTTAAFQKLASLSPQPSTVAEVRAFLATQNGVAEKSLVYVTELLGELL